MDQKFFRIPFASTGDKVTIPDATQPSGEVSFSQGWGNDYQKNAKTDANAKFVEREAMNYILNRITDAIWQYQTNGIPEFITSANNNGSAFPYGKGVTVRYRAATDKPFVSYFSLVDNNTVIPGTDSKYWMVFDVSKYLVSSNNLSDLTDVSQALKNLGLDLCPHKVGDVIFRGNTNDPKLDYPGTTWLDLSQSYDSRNIMIGSIPLSTGGADDVTLKVSQLPSHNHTFSGSTDPAGKHKHFGVPARSWNYELGGDNNVKFNPYDEAYTDEAGDHVHTVQGSIGDTGGGEGFSVVSRYLKLRAWMRTG